MKISDTAADYQASEIIPREQRQICHERSFSNPGLIIGPTAFILIALATIIIPAIVNVDSNEVAIADRPKGSSLNHPSDTDEFGRDLIVRALYRARVSLLVGGAVVLLSCVLGMVTGIYTSHFKILDHILMHICEGLVAIPGALLVIVLVAALGTSNLSVMIVLTIVRTSNVARIVRGNTLVTGGLPCVEAAKVRGIGSGRIPWKLALPSITSPLIVQASFILAQAIISGVSLSFLGAGIPVPAVSWGNILQDSKQVPQKTPWTTLSPRLAAVLCVLSLNLLGDGLRNYLDPRMAGRKKG